MASSEKFEAGLRMILEAVDETAHEGRAPLSTGAMRAELERLARMRGRPAFYPYLGSGIGRGARAMLADGRWVLDFALGVGVHFFGHGNHNLIEKAIRAAGA